MRLGNNDHDSAVLLVNTQLDILKRSAKPYGLGPMYTTESLDSVQQDLIQYRLCKKFCIPTKEDASSRADKSVREVFAHDQGGILCFNPVTAPMSSVCRANLYRTRNLIHESFRHYNLDFSNIRLPTGETSVSSGGDVSIYHKLQSRRQWAVTADCFDYAASVIYQTRYLKLIAKSHMPEYSKRDNDLLWFSFSDSKKPGFEIFKCKLLDFVTIVKGSRVTTVPKNNDTDRVINCEPLLNMIVQFSIASSFRNVLQRFGIDLETAQEVHRKMLLSSGKSTIDLSRASDSNWLSVIKFLYPSRVYNSLVRARSPIGTYKGIEHTFNMLSPMGNGFTFEVMTTTLFFLLYSLDKDVKVFGDDIIISSDVSEDAIEVIQSVGYVVNEKKTFLTGSFKESCGAFVKDDTYLLSYDFQYCNNIVEAFVAINKMIRLSKVTTFFDEALSQILSRVSLLWCSDTYGEDLHGNYIVYNFRKKKKSDAEYMRIFKAHRPRVLQNISQYQWNPHKVEIFFSYEIRTLNYVQLKRWKSLPFCVRNKALIGSFLYSGRCDAPSTRDTYVRKAVNFH